MVPEVFPVSVADSTTVGWWWWFHRHIPVQPFADGVVVDLLAPLQSGPSLALDTPVVFVSDSFLDTTEKIIGFATTLCHDRCEIGPGIGNWRAR